jgi:hypothetical protein
VIITAIRRAADGRLRVRVLPITHRPTEEPRSMPIPPMVKRHLGLDIDSPLSARLSGSAPERAVDRPRRDEREFLAGVDLRPVSRAKPGVWTFGILPTEIFDEIQARLRSQLQQRRTSRPD